jgi:hypothetical protein
MQNTGSMLSPHTWSIALIPLVSFAYNKDAALWPLFTNEASLKSRNETYKRIFDEARPKVRAWEGAHAI